MLWTVLVTSALAGASPFQPRAVFAHFAVAGAMVSLYVIAATARRGQTLGKRLVRIRVVRSDTFDLPGWKRAVVRTLGLLPFAGIPGGGIAAEAGRAAHLVSPTRQGLHDTIAGTIIVDDRSWQPWYTGRRLAHRRPSRPTARRR